MKHPMGPVRAPQTSGSRLHERDPADTDEASVFAASAEATLIVDLASGLIVEANPAAAELLGLERTQLLGSALHHAFDAASAGELNAAKHIAHELGRMPGYTRCAGRGGEALQARMSLVRTGAESFLLVHVSGQATNGQLRREAFTGSAALEMVDEMADGFLVTDLGLRVTYVNPAFAAMVGAESFEELLGESLARWLDFTQQDIAGMAAQQVQREAVQVFPTTIRRAGLAPREVEVSAIAVPDGPDCCWAFTIRELSRRQTA